MGRRVRAGGQEETRGFVRVRTERRRHLFPLATRLFLHAFGVLDAFILARIVLEIGAANQASSFVHFVYRVTSPFVAPFGFIGSRSTGGAVLDGAAVVSLPVYFLISYGIVRLISTD